MESRPQPPRVDGTHRGRALAGLVEELDDRLPRVIEEPRSGGRTMPTWLAFVVISVLFIGVGWAVLQPTSDTCEFSETICTIEDLDIDALLLTVPDADLFDLLPAIDEIDPEDRLTLGDVLELDGIRDREFDELISPTELDRVLNALG